MFGINLGGLAVTRNGLRADRTPNPETAVDRYA